jgi:outer membrane protein assembly factor BamE (lipoprotein component of BamABCDE complex)
MMLSNIGKNIIYRYLLLLILFALVSCSSKKELPIGSSLNVFDQKIWIEQKFTKADIPSPRQKMLGDIVENILPGKNRKQIIEILGNPDQVYGDEIVYVTGVERTKYVIPIDNEYFVIKFNENLVFLSFSWYSS